LSRLRSQERVAVEAIRKRRIAVLREVVELLPNRRRDPAARVKPAVVRTGFESVCPKLRVNVARAELLERGYTPIPPP